MDQNFECYINRIIREKYSETGQIGLNALLDSLPKEQEQIFKNIILLIKNIGFSFIKPIYEAAITNLYLCMKII